MSNNYNIPRKIRELQSAIIATTATLIITYQEKLGNYNKRYVVLTENYIITYQEK